MTFGQILKRSISLANRSVPALVLLFILFGIFQAASLVIGGLMMPEMFAQQPGQPPSPEFGLFMLFGCFSCFWMLVLVFSAPWVAAGATGQMRDRVERPGDAPGSFAGYGGRFYLQSLVLTLIFVVAAAVLYLIVSLVVAAILFDRTGGFPLAQPQQIRDLQTNPLNIAASVAGGMLLVTLATVFSLANAIVVDEYMDAFTAFGQACGLVRRRFGDVCKLWAVDVFLALNLWSLFWIVQLGGVHSLPVLLALGTVVGLYTPYALTLILAMSVSFWLARKAPSGSEASTDVPTDDAGAGRAEHSSGDSKSAAD